MLGVKKTEDNKLKCIEINVDGTRNVLNGCINKDVKRLIFASSSEIYGEPHKNPIREDFPLIGKTNYGITKIMGEELCKSYVQSYKNKLSFTIVRFFNTYGEGQVAQFVLSKWVKLAMEGKDIEIYGNGNQLRSYCHVDDICEGLYKIIVNKNITKNKVYNLGNSSQKYSLYQLAKKVLSTIDKSNSKIKIIKNFEQTDRSKHREIFNRYCSTKRAYEELKFKPKIGIKEGILRLSNQKNIFLNWPS